MVETGQKQSHTPRLIRVAWWATLIFSGAILISSLPGYWRVLNTIVPDTGLGEMQLAAHWIGTLSSIGCAILCLSLAVLLFYRKQGDRMALYLSFYLMMFGIVVVGPLEYFLPYWLPTMSQVALQLQGIVFPVPTLILFLIFPSGHFVPRWTRWLVGAAGLVTIGMLLSIRDYQELVRINSIQAQLGYFAIGWLLLAALGIQAYRYVRIYSPRERQQTKWVIFGFFISYVLLGLIAIPYTILQNLPPGSPIPWWMPFMSMVWFLSLSIQPVAFTVAILRERLWDIDIILRRTVTYAIVTALLAVVFIGSVILLQQIFAELTGSEQNELVTVISTLAIAALFVPVRNVIQTAIDRHFNRKKYDAQKVLEHFARTVRDETDLEKLTGELVSVVRETMQPRSIGLWLKDAEGKPGNK
jgi:hypothetical protein